MMPKPRPAAMAVEVWTRCSGMGPSTRVARPKIERDGSGECESAVAGELGFEDDEDKGGDQKEDGGVVDGKKIEAEESEEDEQCSDGAGNDGSGDVELEIDEQGAEDEDQDGEVGIGEAAEEALAKGGLRG